MESLRKNSRLISVVLALLFAVITVQAPAAETGMIGTGEALTAEEVEAERDRIKAVLDREEMRQHLARHGVDPDEAIERVDALSDAEVTEVAGHLDRLPAGAGVGSVLGFILVVFIVLLITDILGFTSVFPFVERTAAD